MLDNEATVKTFKRRDGKVWLMPHNPEFSPCLLYTSDAADERSSVDLGGRRILKKKKDSVNPRDHSRNRPYKQ